MKVGELFECLYSSQSRWYRKSEGSRRKERGGRVKYSDKSGSRGKLCKRSSLKQLEVCGKT